MILRSMINLSGNPKKNTSWLCLSLVLKALISNCSATVRNVYVRKVASVDAGVLQKTPRHLKPDLLGYPTTPPDIQ